MTQQNSQLARMFRLVDPNVEIIFVSPFEMQLDVIAYYVKMLEINNVKDVEHRLHFITPVVCF